VAVCWNSADVDCTARAMEAADEAASALGDRATAERSCDGVTAEAAAVGPDEPVRTRRRHTGC